MESETRKLSEALPLLVEFDVTIFGEDKLLDREEYDLLKKIDGTAVLYKNAGVLIGAAYFVSSVAVADYLRQDDPCFEGAANMMYFYSLAVGKQWRKRGIGTTLTIESMDEARAQGFEYGIAHTEVGNDFTVPVEKLLRPDDMREVPGFYPGSVDAICLTFPFRLA